MGKITNQQLDDAEQKNKQYRAMIMSMKPQERKNPDLLASEPKRRARIAKGSGHTEAEVSTLVAQFAAMRKQVLPGFESRRRSPGETLSKSWEKVTSPKKL
jgi:signal recognition particle GTPase